MGTWLDVVHRRDARYTAQRRANAVLANSNPGMAGASVVGVSVVVWTGVITASVVVGSAVVCSTDVESGVDRDVVPLSRVVAVSGGVVLWRVVVTEVVSGVLVVGGVVVVVGSYVVVVAGS